MGLEVELWHYPLLPPLPTLSHPKVPVNPLEIASRGRGLGWQQPQGLMGPGRLLAAVRVNRAGLGSHEQRGN